MKRQGCLWAPEGEVPAASKICSMASRGTGLSEKLRTVRRFLSTLWASVAA